MLIGRQERTNDGGILDLLAIAPDGSLVLIELKADTLATWLASVILPTKRAE